MKIDLAYLFTKILRRVAYPVKPLGFNFVSNYPPLPLLDGIRDRLGKEPSLFDQLEDRKANEFQRVHKAVSLIPWSV